VVIYPHTVQTGKPAHQPAGSSGRRRLATSAGQTFLINGGTRVPFGASRGGAKIINTDLGVSRTSWSHGPYADMLEIMSDR
jgi:hypothetical protein